jgi:membrane protease YdiL (CAAX protease family)
LPLRSAGALQKIFFISPPFWLLYVPVVLSAKPWKPYAILRLVLSIFICIYAGSLLSSLLRLAQTGGKISPKIYLITAVAVVCLGAALYFTHKVCALEQILRQIVVVLCCLYAGMLLGAWAQKTTGPPGTSVGQMIIGTLCFQGATLVLVHAFLREHGMTWKEGFGLNCRWREALVFGGLIALIFLPIGWQLQRGSAMLMDRFQLHPQEQQAVQALRTTMTWVDRFTLGAVAIVLAPIAEELLFRGILYPAVKQAGFPRLALWTTSLLFAAIHGNLAIFIPLAVLAILLTLLYEKTNNLLAPITAHGLFNALNFIIFYYYEQARVH